MRDREIVDVEDDVAVVRDHALAVDRVAAQLHQLAGHMAAGHGDDLDRQGKLPQGVHQLAFIRDADEPGRHRRHDLFPGEGRAAALDQLQGGIAFVRAVYIEIHLVDRVEIVDRDAVVFQPRGGGLGTGDRGVDQPLDARQGFDEQVCGRTRADTDHRVVFQQRPNVFQRRKRNRLFQLILAHRLSSMRSMGEGCGDYRPRPLADHQ